MDIRPKYRQDKPSRLAISDEVKRYFTMESLILAQDER